MADELAVVVKRFPARNGVRKVGFSWLILRADLGGLLVWNCHRSCAFSLAGASWGKSEFLGLV